MHSTMNVMDWQSSRILAFLRAHSHYLEIFGRDGAFHLHQEKVQQRAMMLGGNLNPSLWAWRAFSRSLFVHHLLLGDTTP